MKKFRFHRHCLLALSLFFAVQPAEAITDNTPPAVAAIVGGSVTALGAIIFALLMGVAKFRYANEAAELAKMRSQYSSVGDIVDGLSASGVNAVQKAYPSDVTTPVSEYSVKYSTVYAQGVVNGADQMAADFYQVDPVAYSAFRQAWQTNLESAASPLNATSEIVNAVSRTGINSIGQFDLPSNYSSPLDYLMKNNINTPQALADLINQATAKGNVLPSTYTPTPTDNTGFNTGSGTAAFDFDKPYESGYTQALKDINGIDLNGAAQMLQETIKSYDAVENQIVALQGLDSLSADQQAELNEALSSQAEYAGKARAIVETYPDLLELSLTDVAG